MTSRGHSHGIAPQSSKAAHTTEPRKQNNIDKNKEQGNSSSSGHLLVDKVAKSAQFSPAPASEATNTPHLPKRREDKPPLQVPCRYFGAGFCARGQTCIYKHDLENLKLHAFQLKTVLKPSEEEKRIREAPQGYHLLKQEYMVPGHSKEALSLWRAEYWENKSAQATAHNTQVTRDAEKRPSEKKKVHMDLKRLQNKNDPIGSSVRKVEAAKDMRKSVCLSSATEDPGVAIPLKGEHCPICQDDPKTIMKFGIMSHCNHVFCYECIVGWRGASNSNKSCPMCRVKSAFVVKSSVYPYNSSGKVDDSILVEGPQESRRVFTVERSKPTLSHAEPNNTDTKENDKAEDKLSRRMTVNELGSTILSSDNEDDSIEKDNHHNQLSNDNESGNDNGSHSDDQERRSVVKNIESGSPNREPVKRKRTRRKQQKSAIDPNPAKAVLLNNYFEKMKTIPCKYFCDPQNAKTIILSERCADSQSSLWSDSAKGNEGLGRPPGRQSRQRKIPYCKFGNKCHYSHPHPEKPDENYSYNDWERRALGFSRPKQRKSRRNRAVYDFPDFSDDELHIDLAQLDLLSFV